MTSSSAADRIPDSLRALLESTGPSGHEHGRSGHGDGTGQVFAEIATTFADEVTTDVTGSTFATVRGTAEDGPVVAIFGHVDEIALIITYIDDDGFVWFAPVGGWDPVNLMAQRVQIQTESGVVDGVIGRKTTQMMSDGEQAAAPDITGIYIDIGATDKDDAESVVAIGDVAVIDAAPLPLRGNRLAARALDNRLGAYIALEVGRRLAESGDAAATYVAVGNVQEEITFAGARTAAFEVDPDIAIVVDATQATDSPGMREHARETAHHELGNGVVVQRGPTMHPDVIKLLVDACRASDITMGYEASGAETSTDADLIHLVRGGVATGVVAVPIRHMHSPVEVVDLRDIEAAVQLLTAFVRAVPADIDLRRGRRVSASAS